MVWFLRNRLVGVHLQMRACWRLRCFGWGPPAFGPGVREMNMRAKIFVLVAMGAACGQVVANQADLRFLGNGVGRTMGVRIGSTQQNMFVGTVLLNVENGSGGNVAGISGNFQGFRVDPFFGATTNQVRADSVGLRQLPMNGGMSMSDDTAKAVFSLFKAAGDRERNNDANWSAAFQIALWELMYDGPDNLDLNSGLFQARQASGAAINPSGEVGAKVVELLSLVNLTTPRVGLIGLNGGDGGSYIFERTPVDVIPLPPAGWAGLAMLGGLAVARRLRRRR